MGAAAGQGQAGPALLLPEHPHAAPAMEVYAAVAVLHCRHWPALPATAAVAQLPVAAPVPHCQQSPAVLSSAAVAVLPVASPGMNRGHLSAQPASAGVAKLADAAPGLGCRHSPAVLSSAAVATHAAAPADAIDCPHPDVARDAAAAAAIECPHPGVAKESAAAAAAAKGLADAPVLDCPCLPAVPRECAGDAKGEAAAPACATQGGAEGTLGLAPKWVAAAAPAKGRLADSGGPATGQGPRAAGSAVAPVCIAGSAPAPAPAPATAHGLKHAVAAACLAPDNSQRRRAIGPCPKVAETAPAPALVDAETARRAADAVPGPADAENALGAAETAPARADAETALAAAAPRAVGVAPGHAAAGPRVRRECSGAEGGSDQRSATVLAQRLAADWPQQRD